MPDGQVAQRLDTVEEWLKELSYQGLKTERELARLSAEMRDFKNEMLGFKDEMRGFKNEMRDFKDEMRGFKDEMLEFKSQAEQDRRAMNRKWGELANKMGTMVEDLVAPNLPRIVRECFDCPEPELIAVRLKRRRGPKTMEIDCLVVCSEIVLINETKSNLISRDVDDLVLKMESFAVYFPEYGGRRNIGLLASLYVDENIVRYATSQKILTMGMADDTMAILNPALASELMAESPE